MHGASFLQDLVIVLGAAVGVVAILHRVGVPSIAGFILSGALTGPTALAFVDDTHEVEILAEIGVVLLLFGIGLELSLERLRRIWKAVVLGGGIQVAITIACTAFLAMQFDLEPASAVFLGFIVAVSSTAVVLRGLSSRGELDAPHGRLAVGILVFQDLCVIPMVLAVPFLAGEGGDSANILKTVATAALILVFVLVAGSVIIPRILGFVAQTRERDLFVLSVFLCCLGTAWIASQGGVSLELGAFLAGLVVAGSEYRHQALSDLIPTREVFASLFFVSVGMLLDISDIIANLGPILGLLLAILAGKFLIVFTTALLMRMPLRVAVLTAVTLCQIGEFSFVLLSTAAESNLLAKALAHNLLVAIILSMLLTPVAIAFGPHLARGAARVPWLNRSLGVDPRDEHAEEPHANHVIIAGYGLAGQSLCDALKAIGVPYIVIDLNADNIRKAVAAGHPAVVGDISQSEILAELGCAKARLVAVSINDSRAAELTVRSVRKVSKETPVVVRTQYSMDRDSLFIAGATYVVAAEEAASASLVSTTREALGVS